jgi:hypothetical protein
MKKLGNESGFLIIALAIVGAIAIVIWAVNH